MINRLDSNKNICLCKNQLNKDSKRREPTVMYKSKYHCGSIIMLKEANVNAYINQISELVTSADVSSFKETDDDD